MRELTQNFATSLLDHARTSLELEIMLNYNPYGENWEPGERQTLDRLKLAIKYKQKQVTLLLNIIDTYVYRYMCVYTIFFIFFKVRSSSECSTITGRYLVRRFAWFSKEKYDWTIYRCWKTCSNVPSV